MADLGIIQILPVFEPFEVIGTPKIIGINYGTISMVPLTEPFMISDYKLAGTLQPEDNSYKPPTEGQLWPRGDLDAE